MQKHSLLLKSGAVVVALVFFAGCGLLFDKFVRMASTQMLQMTISDISKGAQIAVSDATKTLDDVAANKGTICTPEFLQGVRQTMQRSIYVRQILVENAYGARYCSGLELEFDYRVLSEELSIPGRAETLAAVRLPDVDTNLLRITYRADENRIISAFVHFAPILATGELPGIVGWGDLLEVEFTDGTNLLSIGDVTAFDFGAPTSSHIFATALAGDLPITAMGSIPFEVVRTHYWYMYLGVIAFAFLVACGGLIAGWRKIDMAKQGAGNLEHAISSGEIVPFYQPVIDLSSGLVVGCQMMIQWVRPDGSVLPAEVFVPYARVTNQMVRMSHVLLNQAAEDMVDIWAIQSDIGVHMRLGADILSNAQFMRDMKKMFSKGEVPFENMVVEVAAHTIFIKGKKGKGILQNLGKIGCKIGVVAKHVDDVDMEKIAEIGVKCVTIEDGFTSEVTNLVEGGNQGEFEVVARGVKTREQLALLRKSGVTLVQGDAIARPLKVQDFLEMLRRINHQDLPGKSAEANETKNDVRSAA